MNHIILDKHNTHTHTLPLFLFFSFSSCSDRYAAYVGQAHKVRRHVVDDFAAVFSGSGGGGGGAGVDLLLVPTTVGCAPTLAEMVVRSDADPVRGATNVMRFMLRLSVYTNFTLYYCAR
jgi:hypothetical protein